MQKEIEMTKSKHIRSQAQRGISHRQGEPLDENSLQTIVQRVSSVRQPASHSYTR